MLHKKLLYSKMLYEAYYQVYNPVLFFYLILQNSETTQHWLKDCNHSMFLMQKKIKMGKFTESSLFFIPLYELTTHVITLSQQSDRLYNLSIEFIHIHNTNTNDHRFNLLEKSVSIL